MKRFIVTGVGVLLTVSALMFNQAHANSLCDSQKTMAEETMRFRQSGGARSELDAVVYSEQGQAIADMAFARGVVPESSKRTAIKGFADYVEGLCQKVTKSEPTGVAGIRT
mgnify:CR=1 FL=1